MLLVRKLEPQTVKNPNISLSLSSILCSSDASHCIIIYIWWSTNTLVQVQQLLNQLHTQKLSVHEIMYNTCIQVSQVKTDQLYTPLQMHAISQVECHVAREWWVSNIELGHSRGFLQLVSRTKHKCMRLSMLQYCPLSHIIQSTHVLWMTEHEFPGLTKVWYSWNLWQLEQRATNKWIGKMPLGSQQTKMFCKLYALPPEGG